MTEQVTPEATAEETPASDEILDALTDTEGESEEKSDEPKDKADETLSEPVADDETKTEGEQVEEPTPEEEPKSDDEVDPKEEARRRYEERQKAIAERKQRIAEQTKDYIEASEDDQERRIREVEARQYDQLVDHNENTLVTEFERVKANPDLQMFNPDSDQFNEELYAYAIDNFNNSAIEYDRFGNMVGLKGSLYEFINRTAGIYSNAVKAGQVKQVRDSRKMRTNADTKPAATPKPTEKDPLLDVLRSDD